MKFKYLLFLILFILPVAAAPQKKREHIGYKHKGVLYGETLPNGAKDLGGGLLSNDTYGVTRFSKDGKYMLWLEKIVERDGKGVPTWVVKDVLSFGGLNKNQTFLFSYSSTCRQNGRENLDLIVLAELNSSQKSYRVTNAWRANTSRERFERIPTEGITCRYSTS